VGFEIEPSGLSSPFNHPRKAGRGQRRAALRREHERRLRILLPGQAAQRAELVDRWGHRDATMILVAYHHGFQASELVDLRWDRIDFNAGTMAVRRAKKGSPSTHPILLKTNSVQGRF
jgi:type 1 fimbriae regulatory protein FimB/type 1 fimbriae regulatory protein FimE